MSEPFDWDRFGDDSKLKFEAIGSEAVGKIIKLSIRSMTQPSGDVVDMPELHLLCDDGKVRTVLASQVGLQKLLAEHKPKVGQRIKIVYTSSTPLGGGRNAKNFTVAVRDDDTPIPEGALTATATAASAPAGDEAF